MVTEIGPARREELDDVRALMREYQHTVGVDLCFQNFQQELDGLPGEYAEPAGALLVARDGAELAGMVAMRRVDDTVCEMKRLFVRPTARGTGLGRQLADRIIATARERGYREMRLDTLPTMQQAQRLYEALGFRDIDPYYHTPIAGTRFMACPLI